MIEPELLLAFATAAFAVILIPGPTVLLVTGYALSSGWRLALLCIGGVCLGDAAAMTLTFFGLGAIMATSAEFFLALKWVGAVYLFYLGIELWRRPPALAEDSQSLTEQRPGRIMGRGFLVNLLHPKGLAFYSAFLPQFITPQSPALPQMLVLGLTFLVIAFTVLLTYAVTAVRFRQALVQPRVGLIANRSGALCLLGAGLYTLSLHRAA